MTKSKHNRLLVIALFGILMLVIIRTAWYGDDSFITFRTVDNWRHGFGLTWNTGERVQAYTHPLWMIISSLFVGITGEYYLTLLLLQIALTIASVGLVMKRLLQQSHQKVLFLLSLVMSAAFIEYTTSGLENALSYFLISWFAVTVLDHTRDQRLIKPSLIAALAILNRYDLLLIVGPGLLYLLWPRIKERSAWRELVAGFSPLIAWLVFSLVYYGFMVPNTALAKLNTGIPGLVLAKQGLLYYLNLASQDPITLCLIIFGLVVIFRNKKTGTKEFWLALGVLLYLLYIIKIGGDYMSGRFFAVPYLLITALIWRQVDNDSPTFITQGLLILAIGLLAPNPIITSNRDYGTGDLKRYIDGAYIVNERAFYYQDSGLLTYKIGQSPIRSGFYDEGLRFKNGDKTVVEFPTIGFAGFTAGPRIHIVDHYALSEPLLARLPIMKSDLSPAGWRIGHFTREMPCGYLETLKTGQNQICDRDLAEYYEHLKIVTQGPLFSWTRFKNIISFNLGRYDHLIEAYVNRHPEIYDFDKSI